MSCIDTLLYVIVLTSVLPARYSRMWQTGGNRSIIPHRELGLLPRKCHGLLITVQQVLEAFPAWPQGCLGGEMSQGPAKVYLHWLPGWRGSGNCKPENTNSNQTLSKNVWGIFRVRLKKLSRQTTPQIARWDLV